MQGESEWERCRAETETETPYFSFYLFNKWGMKTTFSPWLVQGQRCC